MQEQRALGNILVRHGVVADGALEPLLRAATREGDAALRAARSPRRWRAERTWRGRSPPSAGCRSSRTIDVGQRAGRHGQRSCPIGYAKTHKMLVLGEYDDRVEVVCADPLDTDGAGRHPRGVSKDRSRVSVAPADTVIDAINQVYERQQTDQRARDRRGRRRRGDRHPRLGRRRADHSLGERALFAGREGASERHPHRARRARGASSATASTGSCTSREARELAVHELGHRAREDHGRPEHRRKALAARRPHFAAHRRSQHRRPRLDHSDEPRSRAHRDAPLAQDQQAAGHRRGRLRRARPLADGIPDPSPERHLAGHGPDR